MLACFQAVNRAAVNALAFALIAHLHLYARVIIFHRHMRLWAGAKNPAPAIEFAGFEFHHGRMLFAHALPLKPGSASGCIWRFAH